MTSGVIHFSGRHKDVKKRRGARAWVAACLCVGAFALPLGGAFALTPIGARCPSAHVVDADGRALHLSKIRGKPILILYEDRDSASVNAAFKSDLSALAKGDRYRDAVALVPVADVQGFNFWPVRGFVKSAIRTESKKAGATIYCDWDGTFQRAAGITRGTSSVILIGRGERVLFAAEGQLSSDQRARVLSLLRDEVNASLSPSTDASVTATEAPAARE